MNAEAVRAAIAAFDAARDPSSIAGDAWTAALKAAAPYIEAASAERIDELTRELDAISEHCEVTEILYFDLQERAGLMERALRKISDLDPTNVSYAHAASIARAALPTGKICEPKRRFNVR